MGEKFLFGIGVEVRNVAKWLIMSAFRACSSDAR